MFGLETMRQCFFVSDLHGQINRYQALFSKILEEKPPAVFLGGDLMPGFGSLEQGDFLGGFIAKELNRIRDQLGDEYPRIFLILGNDDGRGIEEDVIKYMADGLWEYVHDRSVDYNGYYVIGYSYVPPTPFLNKDWERYDISRYVDPGCIPPEEGWHSHDEPINIIQQATIDKDLNRLTRDTDLSKTIFLFHAPPYQTNLDRAALDGKMIDHVPLNPHVGSIAVKEFILSRQPLITLHGHIHESARLTGSWQELLGKTYAFSGAHDGEELALVRFSPEHPQDASRELISV